MNGLTLDRWAKGVVLSSLASSVSCLDLAAAFGKLDFVKCLFLTPVDMIEPQF